MVAIGTLFSAFWIISARASGFFSMSISVNAAPFSERSFLAAEQ